ncbi:MAG: prephenate dehydrogenase [Anaerolineae bacterium]
MRLIEKLEDNQVCIIGLGLIGGSLALALRGKCASIVGYDVDPRVIEAALTRGVIDRGLTSLADAPDEIDLAILAAPVGAILDLIPQLPGLIPHPFHLLDLGSTKSMIADAMNRLPERVSALGGHPMCGKEMAGLAAADRNLFRDSVFVLTPLDRTMPATLALVQQVVAAVGARPLILDPLRHDRLAAAISHVPYLTSAGLIAAAARADDEMVWAMAAPGFRDSTRLAASNITLMLDILMSNAPAVLESLARVQASLGELAASIERGDETKLRSILEASQSRRAGMFHL